MWKQSFNAQRAPFILSRNRIRHNDDSCSVLPRYHRKPVRFPFSRSEREIYRVILRRRISALVWCPARTDSVPSFPMLAPSMMVEGFPCTTGQLITEYSLSAGRPETSRLYLTSPPCFSVSFARIDTPSLDSFDRHAMCPFTRALLISAAFASTSDCPTIRVGKPWLDGYTERLLASSHPGDVARGLTMLGLDHPDDKSDQSLGKAAGPGFLGQVAAAAGKNSRRARWAQHWDRMCRHCV